jgi:Trp operon repressor
MRTVIYVFLACVSLSLVFSCKTEAQDKKHSTSAIETERMNEPSRKVRLEKNTPLSDKQKQALASGLTPAERVALMDSLHLTGDERQAVMDRLTPDQRMDIIDYHSEKAVESLKRVRNEPMQKTKF